MGRHTCRSHLPDSLGNCARQMAIRNCIGCGVDPEFDFWFGDRATCGGYQNEKTNVLDRVRGGCGIAVRLSSNRASATGS